jgi:hypothetical protein
MLKKKNCKKKLDNPFQTYYYFFDMKAYQQILEKTNRDRYKKIGKKYVLCNDFDAYEGLEKGFWLVQVREGCTSIKKMVYPANAEIAAAAKRKEEKLLDVIREASEARPSKRPISPEALADWNTYIAKHGKEFSTLEYPSIQENAEKIIQILLDKEQY